jgi:hypothetical protein
MSAEIWKHVKPCEKQGAFLKVSTLELFSLTVKLVISNKLFKKTAVH